MWKRIGSCKTILVEELCSDRLQALRNVSTNDILHLQVLAPDNNQWYCFLRFWPPYQNTAGETIIKHTNYCKYIFFFSKLL